MENEGNINNNLENSQTGEESKPSAEDLVSEQTETRTERWMAEFLKWLKDPYNKVLLGVLIFAVGIRIYYFWLTKDQAAWWDAADYLTQAKYLGGLLQIDYVFNPRRPFLLAVLWGLLFRVGFGEIALKTTMVIFSIAAIPGTYLVGKSVFNKKVGLISAFLMAIFYLHLFFSFRLMTEVPTLTFFIFAMYFFWEGYVKKKNKMLIWFGVFFGLSLMTRGATSVMSLIFPLFLILSDVKFRFVKNKYLWLSVFIAAIIMSVFFAFIYFKEHLNPVLYFLSLTTETTFGGGPGRFTSGRIFTFSVLFRYIAYFPTYLGKALLVPFILGVIITVSNLVFNFDLLIRNKSFKLKKELFIASWILIPLVFHGLFVGDMEPRYIIMAFPPFFIMTSKGLLKIGEWTKKYHQYLWILVVVVFLSFGTYYQLNLADELIKSKVLSYAEVKQAGEWIKANSNPSDIIFSASVPQNVYYSERTTINVFEPHMNVSAFEKEIYEVRPDFLVISVFEPYMQDWMFTYPQEHPELLVPVQAYYQNEQPVLVIYKVQFPVEKKDIIIQDNFEI